MRSFSSSVLLILLAALHQIPSHVTAQPDEQDGPNAPSVEIRRGITMGSNDGKSRSQRYMESRVRKIEPELAGDPARLSTYLHFFERELMNDTNLFLFKVQAEYDEDSKKVSLTGFVEYDQTSSSLEGMFKALGFEHIKNSIQVLPSSELGERHLGVVTSPNILAYSAATTPRETLTDGVMGDLFFLLIEEDGHYLAHAPEGYICYVSKDSILRVSPEEYREKFETTRFLAQHTIANGDSVIPPGATLRVLDAKGEEIQLLTPTGEEVTTTLSSGTIVHPTPDKVALAAIETAREFLGSYYVWGGKSTLGVDCSGLVQASFRAHGVNLPRDTYMQAYTGRLSATRYSRELLQAGDLLYFLGSVGKINHTAIYIGNDQFIEASGDRVQYTSFNPAHPNFSESKVQRFCFAKRLMD